MFQFFKKARARISALFKEPLSEETLERLEEILFEADLGARSVSLFMGHLKKQSARTEGEILPLFHAFTLSLLEKIPPPPQLGKKPHVILIVGVNGSGKTTSIAKLARHFQKEGKSVLLAAGDTFRAAAIEQLELWADKLHIDIVKASLGGDPAAVAFDAAVAAKARGVDLLLIDTAGRLQNKGELMKELQKVGTTLKKVIVQAPHETLLVLDATTGQNALDQARAFHALTPLSGIILTKLDGSAKGGIILAIYTELAIPVLWVGTGEGEEDLEPFDPQAYADALFSL